MYLQAVVEFVWLKFSISIGLFIMCFPSRGERKYGEKEPRRGAMMRQMALLGYRCLSCTFPFILVSYSFGRS
jgi:hypothetical protein